MALYTIVFDSFTDNFTDGCVLGTTNGTFLGLNAYAIVYNLASLDGNNVEVETTKELNHAITSWCEPRLQVFKNCKITFRHYQGSYVKDR